MKESILHYVWQQKLFPTDNLKTTDGEAVEVIDVGRTNTDAGPDFFNAKIKIGDTVWAGNVEIHTCSSDWEKHNHSQNAAYDSVILHVVKTADKDTFRSDGCKIPQMELTIPDYVEKNHQNLIDAVKWVACADKINSVPSIFIQSWKNALLTERLEQKTLTIQNLLSENNQHWEESFYIVLAHNFGFGNNGQAFELLSKSIPLNVLAKHKDNLLQLEAFLFGQAGLLPDEPKDDYATSLIKEYAFLRSKYNLKTTLTASQWKLSRIRPVNFPHIRIAQFAALIHTSSKLFSKILEKPEVEYIKTLFVSEPSDYWQTHYTFSDALSRKQTKKLGEQAINVILINTVVPFLFYYASQKGKQELKEKALGLLEEIPAEQNSIVTNWADIGIKSNSAYDSQALIQLKKRYCDDKKCLRCRIGHKVLTVK
ncbi:DUF2851 family protein [Paludibacter sp. 221]|uniref:DUF2851 family protein n=1 Tax=Paludibacter sp. 221 TaxID=2302939 RepID=UPI0013D432CE|nr:DUF2851 family protein [Paludibacter sp. 221]NDV47100.1 DUF2851 family protein [Paludibacter sp. 221]